MTDTNPPEHQRGLHARLCAERRGGLPAGDTPEPFVDADDIADVAAAKHGVPREFIDLLSYIYGAVLDGRNAHLADGVQRALGRSPRIFADYARRRCDRGVEPLRRNCLAETTDGSSSQHPQPPRQGRSP